jgi:hypothetical protein
MKSYLRNLIVVYFWPTPCSCICRPCEDLCALATATTKRLFEVAELCYLSML